MWEFGHQSAGFVAALALIAIQVGIGVLMKVAQNGGKYSFSGPGSIAISEFLKLAIALSLYSVQLRRRRRSQLGSSAYVSVPSSDSVTSDDDKSPEDERRFAGTLRSLAQEIPFDARCGFWNLALFYALINNTIFIAYEVADPGTISLVRSTVTGLTAALSVVCLKKKISEVQWLAVAFQLCGLAVTQYSTNSGAVYSLPVYALLFFQVVLSAASGIFNESLVKDKAASLHAQNAVLYFAGFLVNLTIHFATRLFSPEEPNLVTGYGDIRSILVIASNVLIGLAITAVYKYADVVIKCLATGITTALLVYFSSLLFGLPLTPVAIVGTIIIFLSSWTYMREPVKGVLGPTQGSMQSPASLTLHKSFYQRYSNYAPIAFTIFTVLISVQARLYVNYLAADKSSKEPEEDAAMIRLDSPFNRTLGFVRWNSPHYERMPLIDKYRPFFHTLHYSGPDISDSDDIGQDLTTDAFTGTHEIYLQVAETMQMILDGEAWPGFHQNSTKHGNSTSKLNTSDIEGLLYYHFDAWVHPFDFAGEDMTNMWFNDVSRWASPSFECMTEIEQSGWQPLHDGRALHVQALATVQKLVAANAPYVIDPHEFCTGWSDFYYIPRTLFEDYIYLALAFHERRTFHEVVIPTIIHIIDQSRRRIPGRSIISRFPAWGSCCAPEQPSVRDVMFNRMGHRMHYDSEDQLPIETFYAKLDSDGAMVGKEILEPRWVKEKAARGGNRRGASNVTVIQESNERDQKIPESEKQVPFW
ncbi:Uu.00g095880.m01.CDS01 [Anthostomella pinea]|uniref:Uu.00g095880.m01.CDS01 n=1 Tax=Anthostomella pinea TaxID=933095 RepID=A0AAI8VC06_9PEZI|nr:Uu.00g095880.m01.CDS01 [Anthostomella pinea]